MKQWSNFIKQLTLLTQFGFSLITPLLVCLAASWYLTEKTPIDAWIYIPGFFFGLGSSGMVAYKLYLSVSKQEKKEKKKDKISFNRHL